MSVRGGRHLHSGAHVESDVRRLGIRRLFHAHLHTVGGVVHQRVETTIGHVCGGVHTESGIVSLAQHHGHCHHYRWF